MAWIRIEDGFPDHPKVIDLPDASFRLHIVALCYCGRMLTDGVVPRQWLTGGKGRTIPKAVAPLVAAGLWTHDGTTYRIHDYLKYQPSRAEVELSREEAKDRMRRAREVRANKSRTSGEVRSTHPSHPIPKAATPRATSLVAKRNLSAAYEHPRFDVPQAWHDTRVKGLRDGEAGMLAFYEHLAAYVEAHPDEDTEPRFSWLTKHFEPWVEARRHAASDVPGVAETRRRLGLVQ